MFSKGAKSVCSLLSATWNERLRPTRGLIGAWTTKASSNDELIDGLKGTK
jgi:hypothetical protein